MGGWSRNGKGLIWAGSGGEGARDKGEFMEIFFPLSLEHLEITLYASFYVVKITHGH